MNFNRWLMLLIVGSWLHLQPHRLAAQDISTNTNDDDGLTLEECVAYALKNRPAIQQAGIDQEINTREIKSNLSGWYPQITATYNASKYFKRQTTAFRDEIVTLGTIYNSDILLEAQQTFFSGDLLLASKASHVSRIQYEQNIEDARINTTIDVSKGFYDVLLTTEQLRILKETIQRQELQYKDAYSQYQNGLVDKTDYQRALIALGNSRSAYKTTQEGIKYKLAYLKELMGYPVEEALMLYFDRQQMEENILVDTLQELDYSHRVEYRQLQTQKALQDLNEASYRWDFLPIVSGYINYDWIYLNNSSSNLYDKSFPSSRLGLRVAIPIFQGTRRFQNLSRAKLQTERLALDIDNTKRVLNSDYQQALAGYKSNLNEWNILKGNLDLAQEVYNVIKLQYEEGIKSYLELITAETDLRTAQLNYFNALYNLLSSKLDLQQALGNVNIN